MLAVNRNGRIVAIYADDGVDIFLISWQDFKGLRLKMYYRIIETKHLGRV